MRVPNLAFLRNIPDFGGKLYEALAAIQRQSSTVETQVNGNAEGQPAAPPAIDSLTVTGQNGHFNVAIRDNGQFNRGIRYYVEHDTDPAFSNPHIVHLGDTRNANLFLGNQTLYFRAYSAYASSPPSPPAYHGSSTAPRPVQGGGSIGGPARLASQGSGTGAAGVGLSGPGPIPSRDPRAGVNWIQDRSGVTGLQTQSGATPQALIVLGGAGGQVGGSGSGSVGAGNPPPLITFDASTTLAGRPPAPVAGTLYYNSYFGRMWIWTGTAWKYADGGVGAGGQVSTSSSAVPPEGGLWQICDGSVVACALDNCTIGNKTATHAEAVAGNNPMIEGGAGSVAAAQAAAAGSFVGGSVTGNDSDAGVTFLATGIGSTAALKPHTHPIPALNVPSEANGGLPLRISMAWWLRR
jgi:hypothetical protein